MIVFRNFAAKVIITLRNPDDYSNDDKIKPTEFVMFIGGIFLIALGLAEVFHLVKPRL